MTIMEQQKLVPEDTYREVEAFLYCEARMADSHNYDGWEALWTDDAIYWVPANGEDIDPEHAMSVLYDNRSRISVRVNQLKTGRRHTQTPASSLARLISNVEIMSDDGSEIEVLANAMIFEVNLRGETVWGARNTYRLRRTEDGLRMSYKKIVLAGNDRPMFTLSFLV